MTFTTVCTFYFRPFRKFSKDLYYLNDSLELRGGSGSDTCVLFEFRYDENPRQFNKYFLHFKLLGYLRVGLKDKR